MPNCEPGWVLTVAALVQAHQRERLPPRESSLGGDQAGDLDPIPGNWDTMRIDTEVIPARQETEDRKAAPQE